MKFTDCNFVMCRLNDFECSSCFCFDINGETECPDMIHPILNIPLSEVPIK